MPALAAATRHSRPRVQLPDPVAVQAAFATQQERWLGSVYLQILASPLRMCFVTRKVLPKELMIRFQIVRQSNEGSSTLNSTTSTASARRPGRNFEEYILPVGIQHPRFQKVARGPSTWVLAHPSIVEAGLKKNIHRRISPTAIIAPPAELLERIRSDLVQRVLQEAKLLKDRYQKEDLGLGPAKKAKRRKGRPPDAEPTPEAPTEDSAAAKAESSSDPIPSPSWLVAQVDPNSWPSLSALNEDGLTQITMWLSFDPASPTPSDSASAVSLPPQPTRTSRVPEKHGDHLHVSNLLSADEAALLLEALRRIALAGAVRRRRLSEAGVVHGDAESLRHPNELPYDPTATHERPQGATEYPFDDADTVYALRHSSRTAALGLALFRLHQWAGVSLPDAVPKSGVDEVQDGVGSSSAT